MPPKKAPKALEEDFSDVPNLPELNSLIYTYVLDFKNKERKEQLLAKIKELSGSVSITADEIFEYGQQKLIIVEEEDEQNPEKRAKAAAQKLFQQMVVARRAKKEKIEQKIEEAKAAATEENPDPQPEIDPDEIDATFHLPDFPANIEEATGLNQEGYFFNLVLKVKEMPVYSQPEDPEAEAVLEETPEDQLIPEEEQK